MQSDDGRRGQVWGVAAAVAPMLAIALAASGCTPTFNWRETRVEGTGLVGSFPCKPDRHSRSVAVAGATVMMEMLVCSAGDATYAVSFYDAPTAAAVPSGLESLRSGMLANIGAASPRQRQFKVPGMSEPPGGTRFSADGRRPDGGVLRLDAAFFAKDLRVYQAAVVGPPLTDDVIAPFFDGLRLSE